MKIVFFCVIFFLGWLTFAQNWEVKSPYPALGRDDGIAFSINSLGYCVTGNTPSYIESNTLFAYDPLMNAWDEKAIFPGEERQYATVFTLAEKAYMIGGFGKSGVGLNQVWTYDANLDEWMQLQNFPGGIRWGSFGFAINERGYFGCGIGEGGVYNDFWEYEPITDAWLKLDNFPGEPRREAVAVASNGYGYAGIGLKEFNANGYFKDWYQFNPITKKWEQLNDFPGGLLAYAKAQNIGTNVVVGTGMDQNESFTAQFWQFNTVTKEWSNLPDIPIGQVRGCASFAINNSVYFVTGLKANFERANFLAELKFLNNGLNLQVYPNPSNGIFRVNFNTGEQLVDIQLYAIQGNLVYKTSVKSGLVDCSHLSKGMYLLHVSIEEKKVAVQKIIID